jgi:hypothetical protein
VQVPFKDYNSNRSPLSPSSGTPTLQRNRPEGKSFFWANGAEMGRRRGEATNGERDLEYSIDSMQATPFSCQHTPTRPNADTPTRFPLASVRE